MDAAEWLARVRVEERRGELLSAVDLAEQGLAEHPEDLALRHRAVLALARAGAGEEAERRYEAYGLDRFDDVEDFAALGARLAKDRALAPAAAAEAAAGAAGRYEQIFARTDGYYSAINAATMWLVAGEPLRSAALARDALARVAHVGADDYYGLATRAEALLLLGRSEQAADALRAARAAHEDDHAAMATTRRQLRVVCRHTATDVSVLDVLAGPEVAHFCGHIVAAPGAPGRFPAEIEATVAADIAAALAGRRVRFAYGALAAGADILWAEALVEGGAELHVVLPFALEDFIAASVAPAGADWLKRFQACLAAATTTTYATDGRFRSDDALFAYGSELAMGLALTRARYLEASAVQLAVWDGRPASGAAGTAVDVETWTARPGRETIIVELSDQAPEPARQATIPSPSARVVRAMLFGDVKHFSRISDEQTPAFADHVLAMFADVASSFGAAVEHANTWGDALYLVIRDVSTAAECALALQDAMRALDLESAGLPPDLALRLGGHLGPVFPVMDPVHGRRAFMGAHVTRTARIEPVTPIGEVYVTDAFAAALALATPPGLACDYVGHLPTAKDFGALRMHRLRRRATPSK